MTIADLREGRKVRSLDGTSLGKIVQLAGDRMIIEKGFFFPKDYTCDLRHVSEVREDEVWLSASDEVLRSGEDWTSGEATTTGAAAEAWRDESRVGATSSSTEDIRVPLHEEELTAEKRTREAGAVRVRKEVVTEHKTMDVPVTREEVHVERVPASASSSPDVDRDAFQEKTISVPVREEEVEIKKRPRVREEVRVTKSREQVEHRADAEVRHEEAKVDDSSALGTTERGTTEGGWGAPSTDKDKDRF
jgi:uncharacterized protein (TIGR02271 family)